MPCVAYLQEEVLLCIQNKNEMSFDDDLIGMCEMLTTIEAIISIGLQVGNKSHFMEFPEATELLRGLFETYCEQCKYLTYVAMQPESLSDYDISKEVMIQILNLVQCLLHEE